jgi:hypothetical protein
LTDFPSSHQSLLLEGGMNLQSIVPITPKDSAAHCVEFNPRLESHQLMKLRPKKLEFKNIWPTGCQLP